MDSSKSRFSNLLPFKSPKPENIMDWRPEVIRIVSIFYIVLGHMLFYTGWLINDPTNPLVWIGGVGVAFFVVSSAYVHSLKDEFNKPGSLNFTSYWRFLKNRFLRLYIGYYLALVVTLIAKLWIGYTVVFSPMGLTIGGSSRSVPIQISPESLVLDLTCMWPLITGLEGGIFPEAWFICAIMILSLSYPFLRRLHSINPNYLYLIIIITTVFRLIVVIFSNSAFAYHFPFAWTAEFSCGIILGNRVCMGGGPAPPNSLSKRIIIRMATRVWPIYLFHMAVVVFMFDHAPVRDFIASLVVIIMIVEFFGQILRNITSLIFAEKKKPPPPIS